MKRFTFFLFLTLGILLIAQIMPAIAATVNDAAIGYPAYALGTASTAGPTLDCAACHQAEVFQEALASPINSGPEAITARTEEEDFLNTDYVSMTAEHVPRYNGYSAVQNGTRLEVMDTFYINTQTDEGNIPRTMTGRFAGTAQITGSEIALNQAQATNIANAKTFVAG